MDITIYSRNDCPWCDRAKALLDEKKLPYKEKKFNVDFNRDDLRIMIGEDKKLTVPQIFIDGRLVGGYGELVLYLNK